MKLYTYVSVFSDMKFSSYLIWNCCHGSLCATNCFKTFFYYGIRFKSTYCILFWFPGWVNFLWNYFFFNLDCGSCILIILAGGGCCFACCWWNLCWSRIGFLLSPFPVRSSGSSKWIFSFTLTWLISRFYLFFLDVCSTLECWHVLFSARFCYALMLLHLLQNPQMCLWSF